MIDRFIDLNDIQQKNILLFLDKAQTHELYKLRIKFNIKGGRNLIQSRENVLHGLMMEEIDFNFFINWLSDVYLEDYNTLFVYEPDNISIFEKFNKKELLNKGKILKKNIYDINIDNLTDINIINIKEYENQLMFTLAAPAFVIQQKIKSEIEIPDFKKDIYLAYITVDYLTNQFVLSMPPVPNLFSLNGIKKKKDYDEVSIQFINFFKKHVIPFNSINPDWIIDALFDITEEYFNHNNPIIDKKLKTFEETLLEKTVDLIASDEEIFKTNAYKLRIRKALKEMYENQLITNYGVLSQDTPFKVFFNESGKGVTSFKANARGKALTYADSYEIVKKMMENADIASLGITYIHNEKEYPYKIVKEATYYSLKRITTALTEKEIVDNVLRQLKKYQPGEEFPNSTGQINTD